VYDYIKKRYGISLTVGQRVRHTVTGRSGAVMPEAASGNHYAQVQFDGTDFGVPCHPEELINEPVCKCSQEDVHNYGPCDENCWSLIGAYAD
jgi:hypothetical protein